MNKTALYAMFQQLVGIDNVVGIGRGYKFIRGERTDKEAAIILVNKKYPRDNLKRAAVIPAKIDGINTDVIEVGDIRLLADSRVSTCRPASPGISIGHYKVSAGTFGALVYDRTTGEPLILSNNHVLANLSNGVDGRAQKGDVILQPGAYDGGELDSSVIGTLERFIPLHSKLIEPKCKIAKLFELLLNRGINVWKPQYRIQVLRESEQVNYVDCAVAVPISPDLVNGEILEIGSVKKTREAKPGMAVKKSGRSSGLTYSMVLATDVTVKVGLDGDACGIFSEQVLAGPMCMPGDSGSLVLSEDDEAVGLLFAGSDQATMFNKIDKVFAALNISLQYNS